MRVLLADDQPQVRSALRLLLEHELKLEVVGEVVYAEDLIGYVKVTQPDLLLLDWELPGLSPKEILPILHEKYPDLLIIALSGWPEAGPAALAAGVDAFISKGHPAEHLLKKLREISGSERSLIQNALVKDWMTTAVVIISPTATATEAYRLMVERAIRRLPVVEEGQLVGIVTFGDLFEAKSTSPHNGHQALPAKLPLPRSVAEVMTASPKTISAEKTVGEVAWLMQQYKIGGVPVVDGQGVLVGIITASDIFRMIVRRWSESMRQEQLTA
ncbi:MAG: CBS domain-containing protein [Anaerolineae bacterium]|nr:CBS domain-containing protein [Anaerolineae bacterium]